MEKKVFLLYASSKGSKDLVTVFLDLNTAKYCRDNLRANSEKGVNYRLYSVPVDSWLCWNKYINGEYIVHPELVL